jgi:excisionase family DNA binding protein
MTGDTLERVDSSASSLQQLLTVAQVAHLLAVKPDRIYELVWSRRLKAVRIGRLLRFNPAEIARYIESQTTGRW